MNYKSILFFLGIFSLLVSVLSILNILYTIYFDFILASAEVRSAKPDKKIFIEALRRSGVIAEEACHIGDEPFADIHGANNAGIDAILIDRNGKHKKDGITKVSSFLELLEWLFKVSKESIFFILGLLD